ncbi:replication initiation factor domain-containing protein [Alicyclobacillus macrosporangiidus]|uniref:replication initiation factor domain-containing protein n=1 Tax=Alicyclobacillus macrosporangiidus TaxID=392015 RepID=UPI000498533C|nr:replication initiation factor domain-containing protein [Alicyclobacillus macrosporangiidus]
MSERDDAPNFGNTGAETPAEPRALVDWVSITFPWDDPGRAIQAIGLEADRPEREGRGRHGYRFMLDFGDAWVMWGGRDGMGVHAVLSGDGCRRMEQKAGWKESLATWRSLRGRIRRLDVALDVYHLDVAKRASEAILGGLVKTRWRAYQIVQSGSVHGDTREGLTVYFGSPQSLVRCRLYDKAAQMGTDGTWHRIELQTRDERAEAVAEHVAAGRPIGELLAGILRHYLTIQAEWWEELLGKTESIVLATERPARKIDEVRDWFVRNMAPTLSLVFEHQGGDVDWLYDIIHQGRARRTVRQQNLLNQE